MNGLMHGWVCEGSMGGWMDGRKLYCMDELTDG